MLRLPLLKEYLVATRTACHFARKGPFVLLHTTSLNSFSKKSNLVSLCFFHCTDMQ